MSVSILQKMIIRMAIIAPLALHALCSDAIASCGWTSQTECYTGTDVHGATMENMSPPFDISYPSYKYIYLLPGWWCDPRGRTSPLPDECFHPPVCYTFVVTVTWQPDPTNACCNSSDSTCGKDECYNSTDSCCGHEDEPCCVDPINCGGGADQDPPSPPCTPDKGSKGEGLPVASSVAGE